VIFLGKYHPFSYIFFFFKPHLILIIFILFLMKRQSIYIEQYSFLINIFIIFFSLP